MNKLTLFSGIQPSGNLTLGNYITIIKEWNKIQNNFNCFFCIADLHAISNYKNNFYIKKNILDTLSLFLASGINPNINTIFTQSSVLEHTQLYWILSNNINFNDIKKMFKFKKKNKYNFKNINSNILMYPILMASDILLYKTDIVIVGQDQKQNIELTKLIIKRFNNIYGNFFINPKINTNNDICIMSLLNPNKKMSKSDINNNNIITLLEDEELIKKKINKAITDSDKPPKIIYDKLNKPGIYNLLNILSCIGNYSIEYLTDYFNNKSYSFLKKEVYEEVIKELKNIKKKYFNIRDDENYLNKILIEGSYKARKIANLTLNETKKIIGII